MNLFSNSLKAVVVLAATVAIMLSLRAEAVHPSLVTSKADVVEMRKELTKDGRFKQAFIAQKKQVDAQIAQPIEVPVPKDGGGGYTHERHKKNYQLMYNAGMIYQLTQDEKYADYVRDMLFEYAELYPTLDVHPKRKMKSQNPGKFFWQSLNEAVWLVYTIQAYDLIHDSLDAAEIKNIEQNLLKPVALFLSEGQPSTFNKVHNHGTWATAGVGMAGYVMNEPEWVEKALYDLDKSGKGGFLKQLDQLFSPQGYYNEGPYYQRYALMPFVTFAKAIESNDPKRKIYQHRNGVLLKAIDTTIQLSYNGLFFPINDAIKSKGIDTIELVHGVTVAYGLTNDPGFLDIAQQQDQIILTGDGLKVAQALDKNLAKPYKFKSVAFGDGDDGKQGALVVMRTQVGGDQALLFKPAAQGLGHGHFDKLTWQFYDHGNEIVSDYGAARFLNVEAKYGGRYLPENNTYAKHTIAHNTVVVDETTHFDGNVEKGNNNAPTLNFFETNKFGSVSSGEISTAYDDVRLERTMALINLPELDSTLALDLFDVVATDKHQLDLPLHYQGQLIDTNFELKANASHLMALGKKNGYQHLWLKGQATPEKGLAKVSWLNENGRFYTQTSLVNGDESFMFTQIGANDPNFNLRNENGFVRRVQGTKQHQFVSVLEPHGEYNPSKEYTLEATSRVTGLELTNNGDLALVKISIAGNTYLVAINKVANKKNKLESELQRKFTYQNKTFSLNGRLAVYVLTNP
ncbi:alginate lyase family protein [Psychrosphaera sp. B3R10]|uniref:heparinase II/III domain-containing protein n=2 Tax=unclassified Psychrosphaera TaxID=2641570 RepID=UPI001C0952D8|nr:MULTISPECIES: heparinase II/III family protein [unclassified Psychrosphaera]MBU2881717.1 alginate lyase family protein [Psychrosphaera sp. I2R16]MBU2990098.1 alginate lyase family protein [Psychrosphaera sp. B3R10]